MCKAWRKRALTAPCALWTSAPGPTPGLRLPPTARRCWRAFMCSAPTARAWTAQPPLWPCGHGCPAGAGWPAWPACPACWCCWKGLTGAFCACAPRCKGWPAAGSQPTRQAHCSWTNTLCASCAPTTRAKPVRCSFTTASPPWPAGAMTPNCWPLPNNTAAPKPNTCAWSSSGCPLPSAAACWGRGAWPAG